MTNTNQGLSPNARLQRCLVCDAPKGRQTMILREMMFGLRDEFEYFVCDGCGTIQICEEVTSIEKYYPKNYYSFSTHMENRGFLKGRILGYRDRHILNRPNLIGWMLDRIRPDVSLRRLRAYGLRTHHSLLDVGSGSGQMLNYLALRGVEKLQGVDPFIDQDIVYSDQFAIKKGHLGEVDGQFDFIMFNHSLEHMNNPFETLREANARLKGGGVCVVRIPNCSSYAYDRYRKDWIQLDPPRHYFIPSRHGMNIIAARAGLKIIKTIDDSAGWGLWGSEQYCRDIPLRDPRSFGENPGASIFSKEDIADFEKKASEANNTNRGDQTAYVMNRALQ
jgi:SAM-dependent methyltransferase